ncbi:MAG: efflux RND transporter periplasmic adaptor subunit [Polaromonas sp.]|nr:MAG: efflux RND transporter periplasmic adaptor subunit [Polaromonas sp.]
MTPQELSAKPPADHALESPHPVRSAAARKPLSRRASIMGTVVALLLVAGVGGLAWYLTRPAPATLTGSPGGPGGGAGGPSGGGFGGGSRGASTVGVATAERTSIAVTLDALGTVTPLATVKVRPQVSGVLEKVLFKEGQMVRAGELLATLDARQFELALAQAAGQRQRDAAQLENARVTLARFQTLLSQDSIARQEVDAQSALVKQLEGTVMVNNAAVGVAQLNLSHTRITAPISGRVGLRTVDVGNTVSSSDANGVAVITQVMPMDVVFAVPQDRIGDVLGAGKTDMQVVAMDRTRTATLGSGTFASLDNQVDTTTGTVKAKARFANADSAFFASQFVNIQLRIKSIDNAVVVPVAAVRLGGSGDFVFVLNPEARTVSVRPIVRGQATGEKVVIASGLKAGEQVITEGADRLKEGSRVSLAGEAPRGGGRRPGASAVPGSAGSAVLPGSASAPPPATAAQPAAPTPTPTASKGPTPEQRLRMLEQVKDNPEALERRKKFFEKLDSGDAEAIERWQNMQQRMQQGGGGPGRERPPQ